MVADTYHVATKQLLPHLHARTGESPLPDPRTKQLEEPNTFSYPDSTNLHFHGAHVSGEAPADDTSLIIDPGESYNYEVPFPETHMGGKKNDDIYTLDWCAVEYMLRQVILKPFSHLQYKNSIYFASFYKKERIGTILIATERALFRLGEAPREY